MKWLAPLKNSDEIIIHSQNKQSEVIIACHELARFGCYSVAEATVLAESAKAAGLTPIWEWDVLLNETDFKQQIKVVEELKDKVSVWRVRDMGAARWIKDHMTADIQVVLDAGHQNIEAIRAVTDGLKDRLVRLALSSEWTLARLQEVIPQIPVPVEFPVLGRVALLVTPRKLLSAQLREEFITEHLEARADSLESPHHGFPVLENRHGTFFFHIKDLCLLEEIESLKQAGVSFVRLDHRFQNHPKMLAIMSECMNGQVQALERLREAWEGEWFRGFLRANKTDVLFPKLKNHRLQERDESYVGEVVDVVKGKHLAIRVRCEKLSVGEELVMTNPEGEVKTLRLVSLANARGEVVEHINAGQIALIPFAKGMTVKSLVRRS